MANAGRAPGDDLGRILGLVVEALQIADDAQEHLIGAVLSDVGSCVRRRIDRGREDGDMRYGDPPTR